MYSRISQPLQQALDNSPPEAVEAAQDAIETFEWAIRVISDPAYHNGKPDNQQIVNIRLQSFYNAVRAIPESEVKTYFDGEWSKVEERLQSLDISFTPDTSA